MSAIDPGAPWLVTFLFSLAGGVIPLLNVEAYLLALSAVVPQAETIPVALAASLGQMLGKSLLYLAGKGLVRLPFRRSDERIREMAARLARAEGGAMALVLASAVTGIPPFYGVSLAAGMLRMRFGRFFAVGCVGAFLRFAAVLSLARLFSGR